MSDNEKGLWWECPKTDDSPDTRQYLLKDPVHEVLFNHVQTVEHQQQSIHLQNLRNAKLYTNRVLQGLAWGTAHERAPNYAPVSMRTENLTASIVDTVTALIGKNQPKPTPVVRDADFNVEILGRQLDRYLYGTFKRLKVYEKTLQMFNDACWAAIGVMKIGIDDKEIFCERVNPDEIIVDQRETVDGAPIQMHQRKLVPKIALIERYPEFADAINEAHTKTNDSPMHGYRTPMQGLIVVVESWKLGKDGRHVICTENLTLVDEPYKRERFPFVFFRWSILPSGFYGKPLVEEIVPFQLRLNELNKDIRIAQKGMCRARVFLDRGSRILKEQLDATDLRVITYQGKMPEPAIWPAVPPEIYAERERIRSSAFEYVGVSQLSAQAKLPDNARLDSSKAIRAYAAREDGRFARQAINYENIHLEIAEHILELSGELYNRDTNLSVPFHERGLIEDIEWGTVHKLVTEKQFMLQVEASSLLNMTPAAREDILSSWAQQGLVSVEEYRHLQNHPDLEEQQDLLSIGIDDIKRTSWVLDKGEWESPIPEQNLQYGVGYMHKTLLKRRRQKNVPDKIMKNYRLWIAQAQGILNQAAEKQKQAEAAMQEQLMAQAAAQSNQVPVNPETGSPMPAVPVTAQGTPVDRAGVGLG